MIIETYKIIFSFFYPKNFKTLLEPIIKTKNETIEATTKAICSRASVGSISLATSEKASLTINTNSNMLVMSSL